MEAWKKFAESLKLTEEIEKVYFKIREVFQREGWTQEDVEKPPYYPSDVMTLYRQFQPLIQEIEQTIKDYGFNVDGNEVKDYIKNKLSHIDDITPLRKSNGDYERRNTRD
jgi:hypothetical protein